MDPTMNLPIYQSVLVYVIFIWSLFWKGLSLWKAAKSSQKNWFIALLILNTIGILEILYLFRFAKKRMTMEEIKRGFKDIFYTSKGSK